MVSRAWARDHSPQPQPAPRRDAPGSERAPIASLIQARQLLLRLLQPEPHVHLAVHRRRRCPLRRDTSRGARSDAPKPSRLRRQRAGVSRSRGQVPNWGACSPSCRAAAGATPRLPAAVGRRTACGCSRCRAPLARPRSVAVEAGSPSGETGSPCPPLPSKANHVRAPLASMNHPPRSNGKERKRRSVKPTTCTAPNSSGSPRTSRSMKSVTSRASSASNHQSSTATRSS